jgi:hypothetical protein
MNLIDARDEDIHAIATLRIEPFRAALACTLTSIATAQVSLTLV